MPFEGAGATPVATRCKCSYLLTSCTEQATSVIETTTWKQVDWRGWEIMKKALKMVATNGDYTVMPY